MSLTSMNESKSPSHILSHQSAVSDASQESMPQHIAQRLPHFPQVPTTHYLSPYAPSNPESALRSPAIPTSQPMFGMLKVNKVKNTMRTPSSRGTRATKSSESNNLDTPTLINGSLAAERTDLRTGGRRGRGPRRRGSPLTRGTIKLENDTNKVLAVSSPLTNSSPNTNVRGRVKVNRGGKPRGSRVGKSSLGGGKRKRGNDEEGAEDLDDKNDSDTSEVITPLPSQSRSGRKIVQATTNSPVIIKIEDDNSRPPASVLSHSSQSHSANKKKPSFRRPPGASAVCKNCTRGHSPPSNAIVFCDGCNTPWHQHCHDPPIGPDIVQIEEKEWLCADCTVLRDEETRMSGKVSGKSMNLIEKRQHLQKLTHADLVSLLLHSCTLHPDLPIFTPKASPTIGGSASSRSHNNSTRRNAPVVELIEERIVEDDTLPYPKPGNGVVLPPESEDLACLLDEDIVTFSHSWTDRSKSSTNGDGPWETARSLLSVGA